MIIVVKTLKFCFKQQLEQLDRRSIRKLSTQIISQLDVTDIHRTFHLPEEHILLKYTWTILWDIPRVEVSKQSLINLNRLKYTTYLLGPK